MFNIKLWVFLSRPYYPSWCNYNMNQLRRVLHSSNNRAYWKASVWSYSSWEAKNSEWLNIEAAAYFHSLANQMNSVDQIFGEVQFKSDIKGFYEKKHTNDKILWFQANNTAMIDDQLLQQAIELATSRDQLQRRNERERNRVNRVNIAFENLRSK